MIDRRLQDVCEDYQEFGVTVNLTLNQGGYLPVENDPALTNVSLTSCKTTRPPVDYVETAPAMTGEDLYRCPSFPGRCFGWGLKTMPSFTKLL